MLKNKKTPSLSLNSLFPFCASSWRKKIIVEWKSFKSWTLRALLEQTEWKLIWKVLHDIIHLSVTGIDSMQWMELLINLNYVWIKPFKGHCGYFKILINKNSTRIFLLTRYAFRILVFHWHKLVLVCIFRIFIKNEIAIFSLYVDDVCISCIMHISAA